MTEETPMVRDVLVKQSIYEWGIGSLDAIAAWESAPTDEGAIVRLDVTASGGLFFTFADAEEFEGSYASVEVTREDLIALAGALPLQPTEDAMTMQQDLIDRITRMETSPSLDATTVHAVADVVTAFVADWLATGGGNTVDVDAGLDLVDAWRKDMGASVPTE